jgi:hypothetical protein
MTDIILSTIDNLISHIVEYTDREEPAGYIKIEEPNTKFRFSDTPVGRKYIVKFKTDNVGGKIFGLKLEYKGKENGTHGRIILRFVSYDSLDNPINIITTDLSKYDVFAEPLPPILSHDVFGISLPPLPPGPPIPSVGGAKRRSKKVVKKTSKKSTIKSLKGGAKKTSKKTSKTTPKRRSKKTSKKTSKK